MITMRDIAEAVPWFDDPLFRPYGPDKSRELTEENGETILRIVTAVGTRPVYRVNPDGTLVYLRHDEN